MAWYRIGTATFTNGSAAVSGSGTAWAANAQAGHAIIGPNGAFHEIASVNSDTSITMVEVYAGTTASGAAYKVIPTQGLTRSLAASAAQLVSDYAAVLAGAGAGRFADGSAGAPGITFAADTDSGWYRTGANAVALVTGGVAALSVDASQNVLVAKKLGVNVGAPARLVHVADPVAAVGATQIMAEAYYSGYGAGISFASRTSSGGALVEMAKITADGESAWSTDTATQDAGLRFSVAINGALAEAARLTSTFHALMPAGSGVPTLVADETMAFRLESPTSLRVYARSGGVTKSGTITLA